MWWRGGGQGYVSSCKMGESNKIRLLGVFCEWSVQTYVVLQ